MKPEISNNFSYIRLHNIYSTKGLENPSFWREIFGLKGKVAGCEVQGARLFN